MPGVIKGRFGNRKPQSYAYVAFSPTGPYFDPDLQVYVGGTFWDGRTPDTAHQALQPFLNPNEMANLAIGPRPPLLGGYSPLIAYKLRAGAHAPLFGRVFGSDVFQAATDAELYSLLTRAIAAYEASSEINQFSSKYDASRFGVPSANKYALTGSEENGRKLFFGRAQCFACHTSTNNPPVQVTTRGKDTFTMYCYANIGVPKNPKNPFYTQTNPQTNPFGFNPAGSGFIDIGLAGNPNTSPDGTRFFNAVPGDIPDFRGLFKAPSLRNIDMRPNPKFVKAFMHNAVFKSLEEVVHFYNKRNIAVDARGHEVAFDLRIGPPSGYRRLLPPPEVLDNVQNVAGVSPRNATEETESNGQVGNLGLTPAEEADIVNFLKILTDGFTKPNPVPKH
jgi:cytochrome c peroxidase